MILVKILFWAHLRAITLLSAYFSMPERPKTAKVEAHPNRAVCSVSSALDHIAGRAFLLGKITAALFVSALHISTANAEISVTPLRGLLNDESQNIEFIASNPSQRLIDIRVSIIELDATPEGYAPASRQTRKTISAAPWLIITPLAFTLEPGERRPIHVALRKKMTLPSTERRSHLYIESGPARNNIHRISYGYQSGKNTGLGFDASFAISVPIIVRDRTMPFHANKINFTDTQLIRDDQGLLNIKTSLTSKSNDYSYLGKIIVSHKAKGWSNSSPDKILAEIDNIALYTDTSKRSLIIDLDLEDIPSGAMEITYEGRAEYEGQTLAVKKFQIEN